MAQVFLSYSREDLERVEPLVLALEKEGYSVWWDRSLQPGDSFESKIDLEVQRAECVVVVWTQTSVNSQWVKNEALEGLDRSVLVPVMLDKTRIPVAFKQHQCADFTGWPQSVDPDEYRKLLTVIDQTLHKEAAPARSEFKGLQQMKGGGRRRFRRKRDFVLPVSLLVFVSIFMAAFWFMPVESVTNPHETPRLTIIPFESGDTADEQFYASSMTREVVQRFSQFDDLELVQVSSFWDLDLLPLPASSIKQESDYVLSGNLRLVDNKVTLSVRLTELSSGTLLWHAEYRESNDNIFELQKKLVFGVIGQLKLVSTQALDTVEFKAITPDKGAYREYLRGMDLLRRGEQHHIQEAIKRFQKAIAQDPKFPTAHAAMCRAYLERYRISNASDEFDKGQAQCQRALELDANQSDVQLALAELYLTRGEPEQARYHYTKTLEIDPRSADANMGLAALYNQEGSTQEAEQLYLKAARIRPTYWKAQNQLGNFYFRQGLYFQAMESYLRVTQLTTANATAYNNLGAAQYYAGDFENAYESWLKASEFSTNSAAYSNMGTALYHARRFEEALHHYETALKMDPDDHRLWGNIGDNLRFTQGAEARIKEVYQNAINLAEKNLLVNANDLSAISRLAVYYAANKQAGKAQTYITRAINIAGEDFNVLYDLAVATLLLGEPDISLSYLDQAKDAGYPLVLLESDPQFDQTE